LRKDNLKTAPWKYELATDRPKAIMKVQYSHLKRRHTKKKMIGEVMSYEVFAEKVVCPCAYCGNPYSKILEDRFAETKAKKKLSDTVIKINGIDRVNNSIGYTSANSVACCGVCNTSKSDMEKDEFIDWIKQVYNYLNL
jgi:5-methylcytosine-specific restriction endonuclease McrA